MNVFWFIIIVFVIFIVWFIITLLIPVGSYLMSYRDAMDMYNQIYPYYTIPVQNRNELALDYFDTIPTLEYVELETDSYYLKILRTDSKKDVLTSLESFLKDAMEQGKNIESRNLIDYETVISQQRELADLCSKVRMLKWNAEN